MAVGSNIGNVHNLQQGQGLATVIDERQTALQLLKRQDTMDVLEAKRQAAAAKARKEEMDAAAKEFASFDPKYFYAHHEAINKEKDKIVKKGVDLQNAGIGNPWQSTDPRALKFQAEAKKLLKIGETSKLWEEKYMEMKKIWQDPEKRKRISNWEEIEQSFYKSDPIKNFEEGTPPPEFKFRAPVMDTFGEVNKIYDTWTKANPDQTMSEDQSLQTVSMLRESPKHNESDGFWAQMTQAYQGLEMEDKQEFINQSQKKGNGTLEEQVNFFAAKRLRSVGGSQVNLHDDIIKSGSGIGMDLYEKEEGGVVKRSEFVRNAQEKAARIVNSKVKANLGEVEREAAQGVYDEYGGGADKSLAENIAAANAYYQQLLMDTFEKRYSESEEGTGTSDAKKEASFDVWLRNLNSGDAAAADDAAQFLYGSKAAIGKGSIRGARTTQGLGLPLKGAKEDVVGIKDLNNNFLILEVTEGWQGADGLTPLVLTEGQKKEMGNVEIYELTKENTQALRSLYREGIKNQGGIYDPTVKPDPFETEQTDPYNVLSNE